jgi:hypothetical protein
VAASSFSSHRSCRYGALADDRQKARREKRQVLFRKVPLQDDCRDREFDDSCNGRRALRVAPSPATMCATEEGKQKGEKWCKRAIWGNTLPAVKKIWKNVNKVTSAAFVEMWQQRVSQFYARYSEAAAN